MQVSNANDVQVYSITSASRSAIPDWLAKKNKKALKNDQGILVWQVFQYSLAGKISPNPHD